MSRLADAFAHLLAVLDRMEIPYEVGGSVASSAHGVPGTTLNVDIVVDLKTEQIEPLVAECGRNSTRMPHRFERHLQWAAPQT